MGEIFLKILNTGLTAGWLILAVIVFRLLFRRAPKWISCLLWGLVAFKLACPVTMESALSLIPSSEPLPEKIMTENSFRVDTGIGFVDAPMNAYLGDHYYEGVTVPADSGSHVMNILGTIWITGVIIMLLYSFVSYYRLYRITGASVRLRENIFRCDLIDTPFILGIVRPRICLPSGMEGDQMEYVVAHERAHLERRDHWWKPVGFLLLSVYWFQPLCWAAYILLCRDIELACDEKVIRTLGGESKKAYAEALLSCSVRHSAVTACPLAFGEVGVKERIKNVLHYKKPAFWIILAAILCCIITGVCFLTEPKKEGEGTSHEEETAAYMEDVRMRAEWYAKTAYETAVRSFVDYDYIAWRVKYWEKCYTYDDLEGKVYEIYRFDYEFLSESPEKVELAGGMSISGDGWVTPEYPDSRYLIYERDGEQREFVTMLSENDCVPGDEVFTEDLLAAIREETAAGKEQSAETQRNEESGEDTAEKEREVALDVLLMRWREAFCARDAEALAGMMTPELAEKMLGGPAGSYSFGLSSPWPWDADADSLVYRYDEEGAVIYYYACTSDPHLTSWKEELRFEWDGDTCTVTGEELACYDDISSWVDFGCAYPLFIDGTMMDYTQNGLGETLNENALLSSSMAYRELFSPESAAAFLLNLSKDPEKVSLSLHEPEREGLVGLTVTFLEDQGTFTFSMLQPYGENGIWVPVDYRVDVIARMMKADKTQWKTLRFAEDAPYPDGIFCIGEIPEQKIRLYGYNDDEIEGQGVILAAGDDLYYYDWYYISPRSILPDLYWDEGRRELQISLHIYTGTGAAAEELHVLHFEGGTVQESFLELQDYAALLEERIAWKYEAKTRELVLSDTKTGEETARVTVSEKLDGAVTGLELGMISDFTLGESIYFNVSPGYYGESGMPEYTDMPELTFELAMRRRENGDIAFGLGRLIT